MGPVLLSVIYLIGFICILTIYIWMSKYFDIRQTLGFIPGPKTYPFIGLSWQIRKVPQEDQFNWFNDLCFRFKSGMVVTWFGTTPTVNIRKPSHMELILSTSNFINKLEENKILTSWLGNGLLTATEETWFSHKRFIKPGFDSDTLEKYSIVIFKKVEILMKCIYVETELNQNDAINIFNLVYKYALDTICEIALGIDMDTQRNENNEYVKALQRLYQILTNLCSYSWIKWNFVFYRTNVGKKFLNAVKIMHDFTEKVIIQKQINGTQNTNSFLDVLLNGCENKQVLFTLQEIREEVNTFIFSGHNTISSAISWSLFILGNNQHIQHEIQKEFRQIFTTHDEPITISQLERLHYLDRVIKEVLRLYPSIPTVKRSLNNDVVIDNCFIPKGTNLKLQIYQLHHDPEIWKDPEIFNPDRFLSENSIGRHPYAYIPFSNGSRNCIGQNFALLQIKIVLATVLKKWHISCILKPHEMKVIDNFNLKPFKENIQVFLTPIK